MGTKGTWRRPAAISREEEERQWRAWFAARPVPGTVEDIARRLGVSTPPELAPPATMQ